MIRILSIWIAKIGQSEPRIRQKGRFEWKSSNVSVGIAELGMKGAEGLGLKSGVSAMVRVGKFQSPISFLNLINLLSQLLYTNTHK